MISEMHRLISTHFKILQIFTIAPAGNTAPPKGPTNSNAAANPSPRPSVGPPQTSSSSQKQSSSVEDSKQPPVSKNLKKKRVIIDN